MSTTIHTADFAPETFIKIAADSIQALRQCDVYRLLESCPPSCIRILIVYLRKHRPEFSSEIHNCQIELGQM